MADQQVEGGIGIPEVLDDDGGSLRAGALDVVPEVGVAMVLRAPRTALARRRVEPGHGVLFERVDRGRQARYLRRRQYVVDDYEPLPVEFVPLNLVHVGAWGVR